jgi:hypothetical protein
LWTLSRLPNAAEDPDSSFPSGARKFCWPGYMYYSSSFLSFAGTMGRGGLYVSSINAANGLWLSGAAIRAVNPSGVVKDSAITQGGIAFLINLPYTASSGAPKYSLQVSKSGYTSGYTTYTKDVSVPLMGVAASYRHTAPLVYSKHWVVTAYWSTSSTNLNLRLYWPASSPDIGYLPNNAGLLGDRPYGRMFRDGGVNDSPPAEAAVLRPKTGTSYPWYYSYGSYTILIRNYTGTHIEFNDAAPIVRVWYGGLVKKIILKDDVCAAGENTWLAGTLRTTVTEIDNCGANLAPYAVDDTIYSITEAGQ